MVNLQNISDSKVGYDLGFLQYSSYFSCITPSIDLAAGAGKNFARSYKYGVNDATLLKSSSRFFSSSYSQHSWIC